jgi:RNA-directed DNA polymerase
MKALYIEDLASHDGPESCAVVREGGGEALTGVRAGSVLSRVIKGSGVPTSLSEAEGKIVGRVIASGRRTPRGRRPGACTQVSRRENREIRCSPVAVVDAPSWMDRGVACRRVTGCGGKAEAVRPR